VSNQVSKVSSALPVSTSITLAVFMAFVACVLLAVGFLYGCAGRGWRLLLAS
jgi:hypothetical protein